jgi:hypothetical protein
MFPCSAGTAIETTKTFTNEVYENISKAVLAEYEKLSDATGDNSNPRGSFAGCLVRTAGHDFMDFRYQADGTTRGGADGCINFEEGDNTGLSACLAKANMPTVYA